MINTALDRGLFPDGMDVREYFAGSVGIAPYGITTLPQPEDTSMKINRRDFMKLAGLGGAVFASGLGRTASAAYGADSAVDDFYFVQLSDSH